MIIILEAHIVYNVKDICDTVHTYCISIRSVWKAERYSTCTECNKKNKNFEMRIGIAEKLSHKTRDPWGGDVNHKSLYCLCPITLSAS